MILELFVAGEPKAQPRVKFVRGRFPHAYTPDTADAWKQAVVLAVRAQPFDPFAGAVAVDLVFVMPRPKRLRERWAWHIGKPDSDNLAKAVLDALSQAELWSDDAQVARLTVKKRYAVPEEATGCFVEVQTLGPAG